MKHIPINEGNFGLKFFFLKIGICGLSSQQEMALEKEKPTST